MKEELKDIISSEYIAVKEMLDLLDLQHNYLIKDDILGLQKVDINLEKSSKSIAEFEVNRRTLTEGRPMKSIISEIEDDELDKSYRSLKQLLQEAILQKDTNELLIKQGISFTTKILGILNPDRSMKTYNSYGKIRK